MYLTKDTQFALDGQDQNIDIAYKRALLIAAALQKHAVVQYLIEVRQLHPDATVDAKASALCYAALQGEGCMMAYLIKRGANVNFKDGNGLTPLHFAVMGSDDYSIAYLLHSGANALSEDKQGNTPLMLLNQRAAIMNYNRFERCQQLLKRHEKKQGAHISDLQNTTVVH